MQKPPVSLPSLLVRNRNFVLLWAAYGVAAIGDHLSEIALLRERGGMDRPDATRVQALISFGFFLPFVLLGPIAGWWSDRFSRKSTMILADLLRAALVFNLAIVVRTLEKWLEPHGLGDYSIVLPLSFVGCLAAFFSPARQAMLPVLIREDQLVRANALISALGTIGTIISAVVGGLLVVHYGPLLNYKLNALTFILSAVFVGFIAMSRSRAVPHPPLEGIWSPLRQGFRYVWFHRRVFQMIALGSVFWAAAGVVISVVPAIAKVFYGADYSKAGLFRGVMGIGLAIGATFMTIVGPALPVQLAILLALAAGGGWIMLLDLAFSQQLGQVVTGVALFGIGGAGAALLVTIMATVQRLVPDSRRGRIFGVSDTATMGAMVLATGALGLPNIPDLDHYIPIILLFTGATLWMGGIVAWREYARSSNLPPLTRVTIWIVRTYAHFWCRLQREGPCTLPFRGPVILASNHTSGVDGLCLNAASPHRLIGFLVQEKHYRAPLVGFFLRMAGCVPLNLERMGTTWLRKVLALLQGGGVLGVFPQGDFVKPGEAEPPARPGVGMLALHTGATVIPCHISGAKYDVSPFRGLLRRHRVRIRFGPAVDLSQFAGNKHDRAAHAAATALIMRKVAELAERGNPTSAQ